MKSALIGYTGFVGSNLKKLYKFTDFYNSKNIKEIRGKKYDLIVSAATPALRYLANQNPKEDWLTIKKLLDNLGHVETNHFILISTIDVYPNKNGPKEDTNIYLRNLKEAYGKNRYKMELFVRKKFKNHTIIRCPQIYGPGLTKGFAYDLIYDNALDFTHKDSLLQFYWVKNLWKDINITRKNTIPIINFAVEPIAAAEAAKATRNMNFATVTTQPPLKFNMKTQYANFFGKKGSYLYSKKATLKQLKNFILKERRKLKL